MQIILCLFLLFLLGVPISFALGLVSLGALSYQDFNLLIVIQRMFGGVDSIALIAIPLFMLSGELMFRGGMSKRLVDFADAGPFSQRTGHGQYPGLYVLCCHYWFCHCGYGSHWRDHDSPDEGKGI